MSLPEIDRAFIEFETSAAAAGDVAYTYDNNGNILTITVTLNGTQYRRTMTYDASDRLLTKSQWVTL